MKKFALNDEEMQSLKTSLLGFVRRVAFQGSESAEEAGALFPIVNLLLGIPVALELNLDALSGTHESESGSEESEESQESENSGYVHLCECGRSRCFMRL